MMDAYWAAQAAVVLIMLGCLCRLVFLENRLATYTKTLAGYAETFRKQNDEIESLQQNLAINLDNIDLEELEAYRDVYFKLWRYCVHANLARNHRLQGRIRLATMHEYRLEGIYKSLPEEYRW